MGMVGIFWLSLLHIIKRLRKKVIRLISTEFYGRSFTARDIRERIEEIYGEPLSDGSIRRTLRDLAEERLIEPVGRQKTLSGRRPMSYISKLRYESS